MVAMVTTACRVVRGTMSCEGCRSGSVVGNTGNDRLIGGAGRDTLSGVAAMIPSRWRRCRRFRIRPRAGK
ncbi:MAG: hypothetical protein H6962_08050 [Chromatiaceae bacterium]|nr:hypothetical protein [Chromatiaceae bacterium]